MTITKSPLTKPATSYVRKSMYPIGKLRESKGLTQQEAADKAGFPRDTYIANYERTGTHLGPERREAYRQVLGVSSDALAELEKQTRVAALLKQAAQENPEQQSLVPGNLAPVNGQMESKGDNMASLVTTKSGSGKAPIDGKDLQRAVAAWIMARAGGLGGTVRALPETVALDLHAQGINTNSGAVKKALGELMAARRVALVSGGSGGEGGKFRVLDRTVKFCQDPDAEDEAETQAQNLAERIDAALTETELAEAATAENSLVEAVAPPVQPLPTEAQGDAPAGETVAPPTLIVVNAEQEQQKDAFYDMMFGMISDAMDKHKTDQRLRELKAEHEKVSQWWMAATQEVQHLKAEQEKAPACQPITPFDAENLRGALAVVSNLFHLASGPMKGVINSVLPEGVTLEQLPVLIGALGAIASGAARKD